MIAYVDRGVLAYLEKTLEGIIGWNRQEYSYMTAAFQAAYAIGLVSAGWLTDRLGTRRGFALAITLWSVAAMGPGAAYSVFTFGVAMFLLGLGEAANFPGCIKTVAEWFPKKERALATGIFNSGAAIGAITVPVVVPFWPAPLRVARAHLWRPARWGLSGSSRGSNSTTSRNATRASPRRNWRTSRAIRPRNWRACPGCASSGCGKPGLSPPPSS